MIEEHHQGQDSASASAGVSCLKVSCRAYGLAVVTF